MIKRIDSAYDLASEFKAYDRDYYSMSAYEYFLEYYGEDSELDVVGICCEWDEFDEDEIVDNYSYLYSEEEYCFDNEIEDFEEYKDEYITILINELADRTLIENLSNGHYLIQAF